MPIDFSPERWQAVKENARLWWAGELKRPLIQVRLNGGDPRRSAPRIPHANRAAHYGFDTPVDDVVDRWDFEVSGRRWLGDAFPSQKVDFGPGIVAGFLGSKVTVDAATVWFSPKAPREIADTRFDYDPDSVWLNRIEDLYRAGIERWQGGVQIAMTDLGGNLDVLSSFLPGEQLPMDLLLAPDEVKRLTWEAHEMWWRYFEELNAVLQPVNPGYTAWAEFYSEAPYYILQCDFCYMLGPEHFDEFVKPELAASCRRLTNAFYHLDGPGQLAHLDSLLTIPELKGVQWVPGAGAPDCSHWPEVYRKIRDAGKLIQVLGGPQQFDAVVEQLGSAEGLILTWAAPIAHEAEAREFLGRYDVPPQP